jgi:hypothetical protein
LRELGGATGVMEIMEHTIEELALNQMSLWCRPIILQRKGDPSTQLALTSLFGVIKVIAIILFLIIYNGSFPFTLQAHFDNLSPPIISSILFLQFPTQKAILRPQPID